MSNTWVELDLGILGENLRTVQEALAPGARTVFVVKANAYGHGMIPVAQRAWEGGVRWFAVAHLDEAAELRVVLPDAELIIVGALDPADVAAAARARAIPVLVSPEHALGIARAAASAGIRLRCHAKVDTGMGRLGFTWEEAGRVLPEIAREASLDVCGICTHFASANPADRAFADEQARRFSRVLADCETAGVRFAFKHISNSGGLICDPAWHLDAVRSGILLYGYGLRVGGPHGRGIETRPFLQWKTRVLQVKSVSANFPVSYDSTHRTRHPTRIATLAAGYADGYHRALSNRGQVLVGGVRCPVVGRVTMNLTMVDVGPDSRVQAGDEAVLLGMQGNASLWADELATWAGTISYEILTSIRTSDRHAPD